MRVPTSLRLAAFCAALFSLLVSHLHAQAIVRVMPLGDSITYGMGAGQAMIPGGYRDPLAHAYVVKGAPFVFVGSDSTNSTAYLVANGQQNNEGHTGFRIDQIQTYVNLWQSSASPDVVLLHIGTNDIIQNFNLGTGGNDTSAAIGRLTTLISTLYANKPSLKIVLSTLIPIQNASDLYVKNYNAALTATVVPAFQAQGRDIVLVDNYANFITAGGNWNTSRFADYAHPNAAGYAAMAATWATVPLPAIEGVVFTSASAPGVGGEDSAVAANLITAGQSTLGSISAPAGGLSATFPVTGLNDGSAAGNPNFTYYAVTAGSGGTLLPATITCQLDTSVNSSGYDISSIQAITGWTDHNLGAQRFQLFLARNHEEFVNFGTYTNASTVNGGDASFLSTISHTSGKLAANVTGIRFVFLNPDPANGEAQLGPSQAGSNGGTVIHELQAFGTPSAIVPPPPCVLARTATAGNNSQDGAIAVNLIRQGQSTLSGVTAPTGSISASFPVAGLNDGSGASSANMTFYSVTDTLGGATVMPVPVTFELNTTVNQSGYDISSIQAISGWTDHTLGAQRFQLLLSVNHGIYSDFGTYRNADVVGNGGTGYLSTLTAASGSIIATHVTGIRFVFLNPDAGNGAGGVGASQAGGGSTGGTVIHELQAFGVPSAASSASYATWAASNHLSGDDALPEADPNHNGISNLLEYALGGNPVDPAAGLTILPVFQVTSGESGFSFTRYLDRTDIDLGVEASMDLVNWSEIARSTDGGAFTTSTAGVSVVESGSENGVPVQVKIASAPAASTRFLRLKVIP